MLDVYFPQSGGLSDEIRQKEKRNNYSPCEPFKRNKCAFISTFYLFNFLEKSFYFAKNAIEMHLVNGGYVV